MKRVFRTIIATAFLMTMLSGQHAQAEEGQTGWRSTIIYIEGGSDPCFYPCVPDTGPFAIPCTCYELPDIPG